MTRRYTNIDTALPSLAGLIMEAGAEMGSRLGERTMELINLQTVLARPWQREVLVAGRGANVAAQIAETMWVLSGRDDVKWLSHYLPRARDFSDDGKVWRGAYGPRLRAWGGWPHQNTVGAVGFDQVKHVVDLLTEDRSSRRAVISIYDPYVDRHPGKDIPCNDFLSFISREGKLHLAVTVRSNDLIWGWSGINAFEWSALQEIVAWHLGLTSGDLVFNTTSLHVYDRHWSKARALKTDPSMRAFEDSPRYEPALSRSFSTFDALTEQWFVIEQKIREGHNPRGVKFLIETFPEPMLKSWLRVLAWYWSGDEGYLKPLEGTRLWAATQQIPQSIQAQVAARGAEAAKSVGNLYVMKRGVVLPGDRVDVHPVKTEPVTFPTMPKIAGQIQAAVADLAAWAADAATPDPDSVSITIRPDTPAWSAAFEAVTSTAEATQRQPEPEPEPKRQTFVQFVDNLHREKSAAYGDSWKRRGEQMSILANIARKIDRLEGGGATEDETSADTAIDLLVYLIKYRLWLGEKYLYLPAYVAHFAPLGENDLVRDALVALDRILRDMAPEQEERTARLLGGFMALEEIVARPDQGDEKAKVRRRAEVTGEMVLDAFVLAKHLWEKEQGSPDFQNPYRNLTEADG